MLFDALYGEVDKFAKWIVGSRKSAFFFSAYSDSCRASNAELQQSLNARRIRFKTETPKTFRPGTVAFLDAGPAVDHAEFMSRAWTDDPLTWALGRIGQLKS